MATKNGLVPKEVHLANAGFNKLPANWSVVEVGELLSEDRGISVGVMYPGNHDPLGIPLIKVGDLMDNVINPNPVFRVTPEKHYEYRRTELEGGEILLTLVGAIGQCAVVPANMAGWNTARAVAVIRLKDPEDAKFVCLCFLSSPLKHLMQVWANTTVQVTLNLKEIKQLPLPWPPKKERQAIAHILGTLDDKIELNQQMNHTLEAIARALFKSWFIDFDPVRAKMDGRQPVGMDAETAALFPAEFEDSAIGKIPKNWKVKPIGDVVRAVGGATPSTSEAEYWEGGTIYWSTPKDLASLSSPVLLDTERRITEKGLQKISSGLLPKGTVLLSSRAPIGYLAIAEVPLAINQGYIAMVCDQELSNHYVLRWTQINMGIIEGRANGTTFMEISKKNFRAIPVLVPSQQVLEAFNEQAESIHQQVANNFYKNKTLTSIRNALLPKLLSGNIRVKNIEVKIEGEDA
jgi:type I restriction enzyme S subunit